MGSDAARPGRRRQDGVTVGHPAGDTGGLPGVCAGNLEVSEGSVPREGKGETHRRWKTDFF